MWESPVWNVWSITFTSRAPLMTSCIFWTLSRRTRSPTSVTKWPGLWWRNRHLRGQEITEMTNFRSWNVCSTSWSKECSVLHKIMISVIFICWHCSSGFWYDSRLRCDIVDLYFELYGKKKPLCTPIPELAALAPKKVDVPKVSSSDKEVRLFFQLDVIPITVPVNCKMWSVCKMKLVELLPLNIPCDRLYVLLCSSDSFQKKGSFVIPKTEKRKLEEMLKPTDALPAEVLHAQEMAGPSVRWIIVLKKTQKLALRSTPPTKAMIIIFTCVVCPYVRSHFSKYHRTKREN